MVAGLFNFYAGEVLPHLRPRTGPPRRPALDRALRAGRPGRRVRAVELPARQSRPQARRADRRRLLGDHEGRPRRRRPPRSASCSACYDAGLPKDVAQAVFGVPDEVSPPPAGLADHPQAQLHRLDRGRQAPRQARRRRHEAHHDGAGRPRPGAGVRRCRRRPGARDHGGRREVPQRRPGLRLARRASSCRRMCTRSSATGSPSAPRR